MIAILTALKVGVAFVSKFRIYFYLAAIGALAVTVFNYIDNHGEMKATIIAQENTISTQVANMASLRLELQRRNVRIEKINEQKRREVEEARLQVQRATILVQQVRVENELIREELEITRFETLEAMRDDEDFNDWANEHVPSAGWRLLQQSVDSGAN
jgi:hypothetical protein